MRLLPDPSWPVIVLAVIQLIVMTISMRPSTIVRRSLEQVGLAGKHWWLMPFIPMLAAAGLLSGLFLPYVGIGACLTLLLHYLIMAGWHIRARYVGWEFWLGCMGMIVIINLVLSYSFFLKS